MLIVAKAHFLQLVSTCSKFIIHVKCSIAPASIKLLPGGKKGTTGAFTQSSVRTCPSGFYYYSSLLLRVFLRIMYTWKQRKSHQNNRNTTASSLEKSISEGGSTAEWNSVYCHVKQNTPGLRQTECEWTALMQFIGNYLSVFFSYLTWRSSSSSSLLLHFHDYNMHIIQAHSFNTIIPMRLDFS